MSNIGKSSANIPFPINIAPNSKCLSSNNGINLFASFYLRELGFYRAYIFK